MHLAVDAGPSDYLRQLRVVERGALDLHVALDTSELNEAALAVDGRALHG